MTRTKIKVIAVAAFTGAAVCGLAACMQQGRPVAVVPTAAPSNYGLFYLDEGSSAKLAYGAPNSDDVGLMMECAKGSGVIDVSDVARSAAPPVLILTSAGQRMMLKATPTSGDGDILLNAKASSVAAPLQAFKRTGRLDVAYAGTTYALAATAKEKLGVQRFFTACGKA